MPSSSPYSLARSLSKVAGLLSRTSISSPLARSSRSKRSQNFWILEAGVSELPLLAENPEPPIRSKPPWEPLPGPSTGGEALLLIMLIGLCAFGAPNIADAADLTVAAGIPGCPWSAELPEFSPAPALGGGDARGFAFAIKAAATLLFATTAKLFRELLSSTPVMGAAEPFATAAAPFATTANLLSELRSSIPEMETPEPFATAAAAPFATTANLFAELLSSIPVRPVSIPSLGGGEPWLELSWPTYAFGNP